MIFLVYIGMHDIENPTFSANKTDGPQPFSQRERRGRKSVRLLDYQGLLLNTFTYDYLHIIQPIELGMPNFLSPLQRKPWGAAITVYINIYNYNGLFESKNNTCITTHPKF